MAGGIRPMTAELALLLAQDGIANGAIYVLVALGIVLTFLVTRVIFVPFGDLVAYAALTLASLQNGQRPGTLWLVLVLALAAFGFEAGGLLRARRWRRLRRAAALWLVLPAVPVLAAWLLQGRAVPDPVLVLVSIGLVLPMGPLLYRIAFRPIADAPVLVLLIVAVVLHFAISGVALMFFGPEGMRPHLLVEGAVAVGGLQFSGQMLLMLGASAADGGGTLAVLRTQHDGQGAAGHRGQSRGRAADGHPPGDLGLGLPSCSHPCWPGSRAS